MTTTTGLDRQTISSGLLTEYEAFAELLESLDDAQWHTPSRCEGFEVRDVAGHVVGLAEDTAAGVPGSRTAEAEAASVRDDTPAQAASRLRTAAEALRRAASSRSTTRPGTGRADCPISRSVVAC